MLRDNTLPERANMMADCAKVAATSPDGIMSAFGKVQMLKS
ncbi:hypothetical protein CEV33_4297 [Brucella grignonensis]|uniref:Uncharacterized protein n=1 Tax=Brucella grignonensis TaxID=94627 RepID=A0A256FNF1_9HYPH|nr:hypothetical protein CEV33_4297 [Brucella grignonensis]